MNKKFLTVASTLILGVGLISFKGVPGPEDGFIAQRKLLVAVGLRLKYDHYSPQVIDDTFSKRVWNGYLERLDPYKELFLQSDLEALKSYQVTIDDEINGERPISFLPSVLKIYTARVEEVRKLQLELLSKPFEFSSKEVMAPLDKAPFPANKTSRKEAVAKRVKLMVLANLVNLQEARELQKQPKAKDTTAAVAIKPEDLLTDKTDVQLEQMARLRVGKRLERDDKRIRSAMSDAKPFNLFVNVIVRLMDPHSDYFPPAEKRAFDESISNRFAGIGSQLREEDEGFRMMTLEPGSPALKSGEVEINDLIVEVGQDDNGPMTDVAGMDLQDGIKLIRGAKGTAVRLTLKKSDGSLKRVRLIREEIIQEEAFVRSAVLQSGDKKIGYIFLPKFYDDFSRADGAHCADDVAKALIALNQVKVDGVVIDLRFNGGGSLKEVARMVGLFIQGGPIVQVKAKTGNPVPLGDNRNNQLYNGPLAVMVNGLSASASEIFAAAIQDYHRGVVIGSTSTYGKGTVQKQYGLEKAEDGALKLTFEKFYRISGGSTQLEGVVSDLILPDLYDARKLREKDNEDALPWDKVAKAGYKTWEGPLNIDALKQSFQKRLQSDTAFSLISKNINWLTAQQDQGISLNLQEYKQAMDARKKVNTETEKMLRLSAGNQLKVLPVNPGPVKNYQDWLNKLSTDIYIDQTVKVINEMIGS